MQRRAGYNAGQAAQGPQIGFVLAHEQFPVNELVELGVAAEQAGFDAVWTSDHFHPWQDNQGHAGFAWTTLAALGQRTERIRLGTGVTCPTYRYNPAIVAEAFASLGILYPGRVFLGVGTGEALNEVPPTGVAWGDYRERAARLVEAIKLMRELWTGEWVDFNGTYYHLKHARLYDVPAQPIPLYIAASGKKSMRMAGEQGDGLISDEQGATSQEMRAAFAEGARAVGKQPDHLPVLVEQYVVVGDRAEAERWAPLWRFRLEKAFFNYDDPVAIQRDAEQKVPLDQVVNSMTVGADPEPHRAALKKLLDAGVTQVFIHSPQQDQRRVIDFYAREVLPSFHLEVTRC
jgi:TAT-translocated FGD2 family F420-dependent dehydrogenase